MDEHILVYLYNRVVLSKKNEYYTDTWKHTDESKNHCHKGTKKDINEYTEYISIYMKL